MPGIRNPRKRPSSDLNDDDEQSEASYESPIIKRARHGDASASPTSTDQARQTSDGHDLDDEYAEDAHQPGSLVRIKLTNFVTYTAAEFHLGPSLNMIIGPNGTGKSTLVCAMCLGLGWSSQNLGRAKDLGDYVKTGHDTGEIEIELAAADKRKPNHVIRRVIKVEGNKSAFYVDGRPSSQKNVVALAQSFSIQIDNLCQFLPQERVVEFAKLDPVSLLRETQRAAAPDDMVQWHNELKGLRTEEKALEAQQQSEDATLKSLQAKQNSTREDVERHNQRQELIGQSQTLEKCRPVITMNIIAAEARKLKAELRTKEQERDQYKAEVEPAQQAQKDMESYRDQVEQVAKLRKERFDGAKLTAESFVPRIKTEQDTLDNLTAEIDAERQADKTRKADIKRTESDIGRLRTLQDTAPVAYNQDDFDSRKAEIRSQISAIDRKTADLEDAMKRTRADVVGRREALQSKKSARQVLDTQSGQQADRLKRLSPDTYYGWDWLEKNMASLQLSDKAYPPPILSCSVPDSQFASIVESQLRPQDLMAITCTNARDAKIVQNKLLGKKQDGNLGLHQVTFRTCPRSRREYHEPLTRDELKALGFDSWISDHIQGPDAVLAMLCDSQSLHRSAYASRPLSNEQYSAAQAKKLSRWVSGREVYRVTTRQEYNASSTSVTGLRDAQHFTDQPVDTRSLDAEIKELERDITMQKEEHQKMRNDHGELEGEKRHAEAQRKAITTEQEELRKALAEWQALPRRIAAKEAELDNKRSLSQETYGRIEMIRRKSEQAALKVAELTVEYAKALSHLRGLYEAHVEAEIRRIEANSELDGYKADNREIELSLAKKEAEVRDWAKRHTAKKAEHKDQHVLARQVLRNTSQAEKDEIKRWSELPTLQDLDDKITEITARLDLMAEGNPNAIKAYEKREQEIQAHELKLQGIVERLETVCADITLIREQWEPQLDALVAKISDGFSNNFEKIGCAGQVCVYKDEEFEKWAIQVMVRFREGESMSILDSHRQSGGERAVSTIFYLMALQDLARAPFRVVDEINQGMDPRNERMVHERMVDIACRERTSQYFLVTPKLLNDLKFHPKMTVHCITSGEHMPDQRTNLNFQKLAKIALRVRKQGLAAA